METQILEAVPASKITKSKPKTAKSVPPAAKIQKPKSVPQASLIEEPKEASKKQTAKDKKPTTFKKTKVIGRQEMINRTTGEVIECEVVEFEDRDANFEKIWLGHVLSAIDDIGNAKIKVLSWLIRNKSNADNTVIATQDAIAKECSVSRQTVNATLRALEDHDIISKHQQVKGVYMLNPNVIFKGTHNKRVNVLLRYHEHYQKELPFEDNSEQDAA